MESSMQITKIEISGINLTGTVSWARYWILKAFQEVVPCEELQLQTCPISLEVKGERGDTFRDVLARGICAGKQFSAECRLCAREGGGWFHIWHVKITVDGDERIFRPGIWPNFPSMDDMKWNVPDIAA